MAGAEEELRRAMLQQMNRRILQAAAREVSGPGNRHDERFDEPPLDSSTAWSPVRMTQAKSMRGAWAKPGMARLVLERLGEVVASGRRSLYGTRIDSPAALFAAMGGGASAVGVAQFRRALRRLDVAATDEAVEATVEMLDPERCYFRAFDGRDFVRILTPFCVIRPPPEPPPLLQAAERQQDQAHLRQDTAVPTRQRTVSPNRRRKPQKPVWTWFSDGQQSMSSQFIDRSEVLHEPLPSRSRTGGSAEPKVAVSVETVEALMNTLVADARARFDAFAGEAAAAVNAAQSPERDRDELRDQLDEMLERDNWVARQRMMQQYYDGGRGSWPVATAAGVPPHPAMFSRSAFRRFMNNGESTTSSETDSGYGDSGSGSERGRRKSRSHRHHSRRRHQSSSDETNHTSSATEEEEEQQPPMEGTGREHNAEQGPGTTSVATAAVDDQVNAEIMAAQKKVMVLEALKQKLRSMAYTLKGSSPIDLFNKYDTDGSGELDLAEFTQCIREGGQVSTDAMSDAEIRQLFRIIDEDDSGDISIEEVTHLIWGDNAGLTMGSLEAAMAIAKTAVEADSDGQIEEAIRGYEGAAAALRHYGRETAHAAGYDAKAAEYELRIAELRVALEDTQQSVAPAPSPAPATVGANDTHSKSKTDDKVRGKKPRDKKKSNRSKSKDRSRRRSSSTKRSSSRRRSSGWKGDEELADRLTDAEWRAMWGLQSQLSPQLVVSEEEHRRRLGEALAAASSDAALRREDVEKRLQSKDDELTQMKVLNAEKDLALKTLQARTQELLERCGGQVRERDAELAGALSSRRGSGPDRSVHADPFVERTYTSTSVAQNESLAGAVYKMQEHLRQGTANTTGSRNSAFVNAEHQFQSERPHDGHNMAWPPERGPTLTSGGYFPARSSRHPQQRTGGDPYSDGSVPVDEAKRRHVEDQHSGKNHYDASVCMDSLEESAVPSAGSPDGSVPPSEYSTPSRRIHGWENSSSDASDDKAEEHSRGETRAKAAQLPGSGATLPAGLSGEAVMAVLQEMDPAWLRAVADTVAEKQQGKSTAATAVDAISLSPNQKKNVQPGSLKTTTGWTDAVAEAAESARKRTEAYRLEEKGLGNENEGDAVGSTKIAAEFGTVYSAIVGSEQQNKVKHEGAK